MKKIFTFLAVMGIISSSFAQWQNGGDRGRNNGYYNSSTLVIKAFTEKEFTVVIDNMSYQLNAGRAGKRYDNSINVGALAPGKHSITVYENRSNFWGRQRQKDVFCSTLFFKPGVETSLNINNWGQVSVTERQVYNGYGYGHDRDDRRRHDDDHDGWRH